MIAVEVLTDMGIGWLTVAAVVSILFSSVCAVAISRRDHRALNRRNAERNRGKP